MNRFVSFSVITLAVLTLFITGTTMAQDVVVTPAPDLAFQALIYGGLIVLALLILAALIFGARIVKALETLVPAETAASIYQSGLRLGIEFGLQRAQQTASPLDDEFFVGLAKQRGLTVHKDENGVYHVVSPAEPTGVS